MTESEKLKVLAKLKLYEEAADRIGLMATAQSWRDMQDSVAARPADEIILAEDKRQSWLGDVA